MTEEPIYECQNCGRDLKGSQIGKVTWCTGCQIAWDVGFNSGMRAYRRLIEEEKSIDAEVYAEAIRLLEPFRVKK